MTHFNHEFRHRLHPRHAPDSSNPPTKPVRISDLLSWKAEGSKWAMLTAYDYSTAQAMSQADIPVLLVGDSAANVIYGYKTTTKYRWTK